MLDENQALLSFKEKNWIKYYKEDSMKKLPCVSLNNKIVVISKSDREGIHIDYTVAQVIPDKPKLDYKK